MNDILKSIIVGIVLFLAMEGLLRIAELNTDILDYCTPKAILGWGYVCEYTYQDLHPIYLDNITITFIPNQSLSLDEI